MGEISVVRIVEAVFGILTAAILLGVFDQARHYIKEKARPKPGGRFSIDRYLLRLAVGILNPDWMPEARPGETVRQTLTVVWDVYALRRWLTIVLVAFSTAVAIVGLFTRTGLN